MLALIFYNLSFDELNDIFEGLNQAATYFHEQLKLRTGIRFNIQNLFPWRFIVFFTTVGDIVILDIFYLCWGYLEIADRGHKIKVVLMHPADVYDKLPFAYIS